MDTKYYLERRFQDPYDKERGVQPFYLKSIYDFYSSYGKFLNPTSCKLLEFGGGPCIYPLISATPHVSEIAFADYDQINLEAVQAWRSDSKSAHNWNPYFEYVMKELEGEQADVKSRSLSRQKELKEKMTNYLLVDIRSDKVFCDENAAENMYDIVSTNFCLDAVAETQEEYIQFVSRSKNVLIVAVFLLEWFHWKRHTGR